ncbi:hypothetical protein [Asaia bogorensis]|uniref:Uncharacterized protein n=1 Tax=Asaia bogorensis NBRC 16594 TaxID=1231624 RepID=A0AAN4R4T4_9PROT|nr:hypothetical protein [Asaia bogorensis]GBQ81442.1 hypothetical protein AA0311_2620 [Asaia bogorensis NBRC 16594]GEL54864.1 hypothetical protein ABO01nite_28710 [Asaia bogorensis NBRC 16594]
MLFAVERQCCRKLGAFLALTGMMGGAPSAVFGADDQCNQLVQAAADGMAGVIKADDTTIKQPQDITQFTCLGNFFNGVGLDVITSGLNPASIAQKVAGQFCSALTDKWNSLQGAAQCGLTVTGINTNFGAGLGTGSGTFCPSINLGGGGDTLVSASTNTSGQQSWGVEGSTQMPDGYAIAPLGTSTGLTEQRQ